MRGEGKCQVFCFFRELPFGVRQQSETLATHP